VNAPIRLAAFAATLGLVFGAAVLAGAAIDPTDDSVTAATGHGGHASTMDGQADGEHDIDSSAANAAGARAGGAPAASGLAVSDDGYSLEIGRGFFTAGETAPFSFRITDARGRAVRDEFELEHDKQLL